MKRNHLGGLSGRHQWGEASPGEPPGHTKRGFGGGQGFQPSLTDALRFDIQGVALVA
jgi:hypothetical protein